MSKNKKQSYSGDDDPAQSDAQPSSLSDQEVEISLTCLKYFRGDWDMYLDFLQGPRVTDVQRRKELPLVEQLRDRDRRTDYLTYFLEDEVVTIAQKMPFLDLLRVWEECIFLHPDADPFGEQVRPYADSGGQEDTNGDEPHTLH